MSTPNGNTSWTFLSNHAHVLICLARDPDARLRDLAVAVGLTERAIHRIVTELEAAGGITRTREGRRTHYELNLSMKLRHPLETDRTVGSLLRMVLSPSEAKRVGLRPTRTQPGRA